MTDNELSQEYLKEKLAGTIPLINRYTDRDTGKIIYNLGKTTTPETFEEYKARKQQ